MSNKNFHIPSNLEFNSTEIYGQEYWLDFTEEVRGNVAGFIILIIGFAIVMLAILSIVLLLVFPILVTIEDFFWLSFRLIRPY